jgi:hypothetical protein
VTTHIPIVVFSIREQGNILKVLDGSGTFTVVRKKRIEPCRNMTRPMSNAA